MADVVVGFLVAALFAVVVIVVLVLWAGLDRFGLLHFGYLLLVVAFPLGTAWIVTPHLIDAERRTPFLGWLLLLGSLVVVPVGVWATHVEPFRLQVDTEILGATGVDSPIVVGVIADLQTTTIGSHERAALDAVLDGDPDLVVLPGDVFQLEPEQLADALPEFIGWLRTLTDAVDDVVIVNGHADDAEILSDMAETTGALYLENEVRQIRIGRQRLQIVGVSTSPEEEPGHIDPILLEQIDDGLVEDDLVLMLSHHPDTVLTLPSDAPIDLVISGHTHGGQVSLPRIGPIFTLSDVPRVVAAGGLHVVDGHPIYVSTGVGLERGQAPQVRLGVPPSVGLLTIVPA